MVAAGDTPPERPSAHTIIWRLERDTGSSSSRMRFYKLLCLARPGLSREDLSDMLRVTSATVYNSGGQIFDLASFGDRPLEYSLRAHGDRYKQVAKCCSTPCSRCRANGPSRPLNIAGCHLGYEIFTCHPASEAKLELSGSAVKRRQAYLAVPRAEGR